MLTTCERLEPVEIRHTGGRSTGGEHPPDAHSLRASSKWRGAVEVAMQALVLRPPLWKSYCRDKGSRIALGWHSIYTGIQGGYIDHPARGPQNRRPS